MATDPIGTGPPSNPFGQWTFLRIVITLIVVAMIVAITYVALGVMGIAIPAWVVTMFWIVVVGVAAIILIKFLWRFIP